MKFLRLIFLKLFEDRIVGSLYRIVCMFLTIIGILKGLAFINIDLKTVIMGETITPTIFILLVFVSVELLLARKLIKSKKDISISFLVSLENELVELIEKKNYRKIIRLRDAMSRYLWIEGSLNTRIKLGEIAEVAALHLDDKENQVAALIDDLGWTLVATMQYERANKCIQHGRAIAKENHLTYWEAKAHRHLSGIQLIKKNYKQTYKELEESRNLAEKVNGSKKIELLAGIEYTIAVTALKENKLEKAEMYLIKSENLRLEVGDESRMIRNLSLKGKIEFAKNNFELAKDFFRKGLTKATEIGRRDEMIRNHTGLAMLYKLEMNTVKYEDHKSKADNLKKDTPVPFEIDDAEMQLQQI